MLSSLSFSPVTRSSAVSRISRRSARWPRAVSRLAEAAEHRRDKRMHFVLVKAVEAVVERAQRDGVECQPSHVIGDVDDGPIAEPLPFEHELLCDIEHAIEHAAHTERTEGRS